MELKQISYSQFVGGSQEWVLDNLTFKDINLLVGENATGKTRCLNIISNLAKLVSGYRKQLFTSSCFDAVFESDKDEVRYILEIKNSKVLNESFVKNGENLMTRGQGGAGEIFTKEIGTKMNFQTPETSLAAVARQDEIQHGFLECLPTWGNTVIHYAFGSPMGQDRYMLTEKNSNEKLDPRETHEVIRVFLKGKKELGKPYIEAIKNDFGQIHYHIEDIGIKKPTVFSSPTDLKGGPVGLYVEETDLPGITEQFDMSQGMFRVLSLIIQVNYCQMAMKPSCIIIDDIGEGLDFERSVCLINLLMEKAANSHIQIIMATNNKFVMNRVPLETWSVLKREINRCNVYNYANSKEKFDNFKFTGMNNFDFFMSDFISEELPKDE